MPTHYIVILIIGSITLTKKIAELVQSVKAGNKDKMKADIFFLLITLGVIAVLFAL